MRYISWIFTIPLLIILVLFALYNRALVTIDVLGLGVTVDLPIYGLTYGAIFFGFVVGGVSFWFSGAKRRRANRLIKKEKLALEKQVKGLEDKLSYFDNESALSTQNKSEQPLLTVVEGA